MDLVLSIVSLVLLVFQVLLIVRAVLDWSVVLAGPTAAGSARARLTSAVWTVTEPVLAPVRRVLPPLRVGGAAIDLSFIAVLLLIVVIRSLIS